MNLIFEWDARKAQANCRKHKVSFEEGKTAFGDPLLITFPDEAHSSTEERYVSIGVSSRGRILLIVHTEQEESEGALTIRIISCRKATGAERRTYEEEPL
jgi:uncharacterized DUF497 family protein